MDSYFMKKTFRQDQQDKQENIDHFPPARHRPPEADSGEAGGDENGQNLSPPAKLVLNI
jgi:hypothetical protein